jgi:hypothetical protein
MAVNSTAGNSEVLDPLVVQAIHRLAAVGLGCGIAAPTGTD